ncbi:S-layer homology domain-containing protein [Cytobacillus gottheilii]|uniref:S-layer homology domain-containing protein n=1 Tax=Cytobacillus gottheilii TaxID=859144 RepID=UPI0024956E4D|nr:S-layer homology domain-containing protein [Cytobacillus gottheilii]
MNKQLSKFLAAGTTAAVAVSVVAPAVSAEEVTEEDFEFDFGFEHPFTDVKASYEEAVSFLYFIEVISGVSETSFGTDLQLKRGDAAVILANTLGLDTENAPDAGFTDLNNRVKGAVNALYAEGIISGVSATKFAPDDKLSRGAMAKLLVNAFELEEYAIETPFTDVGGTFAPYVEALYGAEITNGKSATQYGIHDNIKRGDFANLLYSSLMFSGDLFESPVTDVKLVDSKTVTVTFAEAMPEDITAEEVAEYMIMGVDYKNEEFVMLMPYTAKFSADRKELTMTHLDLQGQEGIFYLDEFEIPYDYSAPVAGKGDIILEGQNSAVTFDFAGGTTASVTLESGEADFVNLNSMSMEVLDQNADETNVNLILKDTDVPSYAPGIGLNWGTLEYKDGQWQLVDPTNYVIIPVGHYTLEAEFKDTANHATTVSLKIEVK